MNLKCNTCAARPPCRSPDPAHLPRFYHRKKPAVFCGNIPIRWKLVQNEKMLLAPSTLIFDNLQKIPVVQVYSQSWNWMNGDIQIWCQFHCHLCTNLPSACLTSYPTLRAAKIIQQARCISMGQGGCHAARHDCVCQAQQGTDSCQNYAREPAWQIYGDFINAIEKLGDICLIGFGAIWE